MPPEDDVDARSSAAVCGSSGPIPMSQQQLLVSGFGIDEVLEAFLSATTVSKALPSLAIEASLRPRPAGLLVGRRSLVTARASA